MVHSWGDLLSPDVFILPTFAFGGGALGKTSTIYPVGETMAGLPLSWSTQVFETISARSLRRNFS